MNLAHIGYFVEVKKGEFPAVTMTSFKTALKFWNSWICNSSLMYWETNYLITPIFDSTNFLKQIKLEDHFSKGI